MLSTEVVSANDDAETVKGEVLVLQAKVGAVTNLLGHDQCSNCDLYLVESPFWSGKMKKI